MKPKTLIRLNLLSVDESSGLPLIKTHISPKKRNALAAAALAAALAVATLAVGTRIWQRVKGPVQALEIKL